MTVIAYKDGVVAFDSRVTKGADIYSDNCEKHTRVHGLSFWTAGNPDDEDDLIAWVFDPTHTFSDGVNIEGLVWDGKDLWHVAAGDEGPWKFKLDKKACAAMGAGAQLALGAMEFGATAVEAVKVAKARNATCGGKTRIKKLW